MKTKFTKFDPKYPLWRQFLSAGTEWIDAYVTLKNYSKQNHAAVAIFYAPPFALSMSLECITKALASYYDISFDPFKYGHQTSKIITDYAPNIPLFESISRDEGLIELIKEYQNTLDTKFGGTYVVFDGEEAKLLLDVVCNMRTEVLNVSGMKF